MTASDEFGSTFIAVIDMVDSDGAALIDQVEALIAGGTLTQNQGAGLIDKLNQVSAKLDASQTGAACNQLSAFLSQVQGYINSNGFSGG